MIGVTGGAGFIRSAVGRALPSRRQPVHVVDNLNPPAGGGPQGADVVRAAISSAVLSNELIASASEIQETMPAYLMEPARALWPSIDGLDHPPAGLRRVGEIAFSLAR